MDGLIRAGDNAVRQNESYAHEIVRMQDEIKNLKADWQLKNELLRGAKRDVKFWQEEVDRMKLEKHNCEARNQKYDQDEDLNHASAILAGDKLEVTNLGRDADSLLQGIKNAEQLMSGLRQRGGNRP